MMANEVGVYASRNVPQISLLLFSLTSARLVS
jgi:hypothetical protein